MQYFLLSIFFSIKCYYNIIIMYANKLFFADVEMKQSYILELFNREFNKIIFMKIIMVFRSI
jgi:hypothetical protein